MTNISVAEAKPDKLFYVTANVALVKPTDKSCLLLKRGGDEKEAAHKWCLAGGKGEHKLLADGRVSKFFATVGAVECLEETGLAFDKTKSITIDDGAFVREDGIPVVWGTVAAPYDSGEVTLEEGSFSEYGWFTEDTLPPAEECVGTVRDEAVIAIRALSSQE